MAYIDYFYVADKAHDKRAQLAAREIASRRITSHGAVLWRRTTMIIPNTSIVNKRNRMGLIRCGRGSFTARYVAACWLAQSQHVWSILALRHLPNCVVPPICPLLRELQGLSQGLVSLIEPLAVSLLLHHVLQNQAALGLEGFGGSSQHSI